MKKSIKRSLDFLLLLSKSTPKQRHMLLQNADKSQIVTLSEICLNVLAGNVPVNVKKLRRYKNCIRKVACRKVSLKAKKKLLVQQSGGFLPLLIPAVVSALAGMAGRAIGNRI
ncbi:uncharacterized protein TNCT_138061 [Trichonephila clavata]|uniref:Uncharacterized protein n=1 Tax=Trichonephila clavata TaxID=2740835 RepID=A0A8X6GW98_TRICU|nr:uncharacterized protein TNCT_138061 [Trichonephila clavata]